MQNRIITVMLELRQRTSCREKCKELQMLTVPSLYIIELIMFIIKNPDKYQTNASIHSKDTRQKNQLRLYTVRLASIQNGACHSSVEIFSKLPPQIVQLRDDTIAFRNIKKNLIKRSFIQ
jgi:hypothetical protein